MPDREGRCGCAAAGLSAVRTLVILRFPTEREVNFDIYAGPAGGGGWDRIRLELRGFWRVTAGDNGWEAGAEILVVSTWRAGMGWGD